MANDNYQNIFIEFCNPWKSLDVTEKMVLKALYDKKNICQ